MNIDKKQTILAKIDQLTNEYSVTKYNHLKIPSLIKITNLSFNFKDSCPECNSNINKIEKLVDQLPNLEDIYQRNSYEKEFNNIRTHFHKDHGYYAPMHNISIFSIIGLIAGTITAVLFSFVTTKTFVVDILFIGAILGLIVGYLSGSFKDNKIRKQDRLL